MKVTRIQQAMFIVVFLASQAVRAQDIHISEGQDEAAQQALLNFDGHLMKNKTPMGPGATRTSTKPSTAK